jgi:hypothetical protein
MQVLRDYALQIVALLIAVGALLVNRLAGLRCPELDALSYSIIGADLFLFYLRSQVLPGFSTIDASTVSDPAVRSIVVSQIAGLREETESSRQTGRFGIRNPQVARDLSFDILGRSRANDEILASLNLVERPFLLGRQYRTYFNDRNRLAVEGASKKLSITRVLVVNDPIRATVDYQALKKEQENIGVTIVECSPADYSLHFDSDVIIRLGRGNKECLLGGKDPKTPLDSYRAVYVTGAAVDEFTSRFRALLSAVGDKA